MSKPKYAVVVVHGIGAGTGKEREGFSLELKKGVAHANSECESLWFEVPWEGLNDSVDEEVRKVSDELFDSYIRDAEKEKQRVEESMSSVNVDSGWLIWKWIKKIYVLFTRKVSGVAPDALLKAKKIMPNALDAVLDLPIYLGNDRAKDIRAAVFAKIDEAMGCGVDGIVLIGHSLGSVIAFDVLQEELRGRKDSRIKALVTLGSPLEWVTKIRRAMSAEAGELPLGVCGTKWINCYDPQDPVPLRRALDSELFKGVENVEDISGEKLIDAHCAYWKSQRIAEKIAGLIGGDLQERSEIEC